jgi:hypothetical protein
MAQPALLPSGAIQASVTDMARFMIAHLQNGRYSDAALPEARILKETTARQMHTTLYAPDPRILGTAYGFFDFSDNGQRTIGHSGYLPPMHSILLLLPDQNLGVFVDYNSEGGGELTNQHIGFQRAFFDHYYPAPASSPIQPPEDFAERAGRFAGSYRQVQGSYTTIDKVGLLFGEVKISDSGDGALLLTTPWGKWRLVEVEPLYFREANGQFSVLFREDGKGRITHMFTDLTPMFAFGKLSWYETFGFNMALALGCVLLFLSTIPAAAIHFIRNRRLNGGQKPAARGARVALLIIIGISVLNLLFVAGTALWGIQQNILAGTSPIAKIVLGLGVLSAVLAVGALVCTALAWKNRYWGTATRVYFSLVTLAAVAFVWFLNNWNLLGWRL